MQIIYQSVREEKGASGCEDAIFEAPELTWKLSCVPLDISRAIITCIMGPHILVGPGNDVHLDGECSDEGSIAALVVSSHFC